MEQSLLQREAIVAALEAFPDEFARIAMNGRDPEALFAPGSDGGWGIIEILCHLADWEAIYLERASRIIGEERPYIQGYDDELWPIERDYRGQDPLETIERFRALRQEHVELLKSLTPEDWERAGEHGYFGEVTMRWLEDHTCGHDIEHLAQARDVLS